MYFREHTYSVLIVSASEKFTEHTKSLLAPGEYWPVRTVRSVGEARRLLLDQEFDIVMINAPLPDDFGTKLAADLCESTDSSVMLFVKNDIYDDVCFKMLDHGAVCISKPTNSAVVTQNLRIMCATRERMARFAARQATLEDRMSEIRLINKAKWKLIESKGMTENEAHKFIERRATDLRMTKKAVAEEILLDNN